MVLQSWLRPGPGHSTQAICPRQSPCGHPQEPNKTCVFFFGQWLRQAVGWHIHPADVFHLQALPFGLFDDPFVPDVNRSGTGLVEWVHDHEVRIQAVSKDERRGWL